MKNTIANHNQTQTKSCGSNYTHCTVTLVTKKSVSGWKRMTKMQNYYNFEYQRIGWIKGDIYRQVVTPENPIEDDGVGILRYIVGDFKKKGVNVVRVLDPQTNNIYVTKAEKYLAAYQESLKDAQYVYLPITEFRVVNHTKVKY